MAVHKNNLVVASHRKLREEKALEMMMLSLLTYMPSTSFKRNSILNQQTRVPSINTHLTQKAIMVSNIKMKAASFIGSTVVRRGNGGALSFHCYLFRQGNLYAAWDEAQ